jgi:hypothetical protein
VGRRRGIVRVGMVVVMTAISFLTGLVPLGWSRWLRLPAGGSNHGGVTLIPDGPRLISRGTHRTDVRSVARTPVRVKRRTRKIRTGVCPERTIVLRSSA